VGGEALIRRKAIEAGLPDPGIAHAVIHERRDGEPVVPPLWAWVEKDTAVVFIDPDKLQVVGGWRVTDLQDMGWKGNAADYRRSLLRLDPSPLAAVR
jgi:hypothetical protein